MTIKEITDNHIFLQVTNVVGARLDGTYVKSRSLWRIPYNLGALRDLHMLGYDVAELGNRLSKAYKEVLDMKSISSELDKGTELREYQRQDVNFLTSLEYAGVFNEQRTGKTPTTCRVIERIGKRAVIICPASLVLNWRDEIEKWTNMNPIAVVGSKKKREQLYKEFYMNGGVIVISKETARNDVSLIQSLQIHTLVVDEAHFLRNRGTKQSEAIFSLARLAKRKYALTGTPATSKPSDVFGILHFLDPVKWSSYWGYAERYFKVTNSFWGGNAKEVGDFKNPLRKREHEELLNLVSVQRKRKDVMKWLPDKQYQTIRIPMTAQQRKAYDEMRTMFEVEEIGLDASTVLAQMTRLRQITSVPEVLGLAQGAKEAFIYEWLENNPDEQILVFSNFSSGLDIMHKRLIEKKIKTATITGKVTKETRSKVVKWFQEGVVKVLLCNIEAAGTGLTLDAASTVIFLDRHANPAQNDQAEDRIVATQQDRNLNALIIDLVCEQSIDERILELVKQKKDLTSFVNNYRNVRELLK